jgi:hypothetical protein
MSATGGVPTIGRIGRAACLAGIALASFVPAVSGFVSAASARQVLVGGPVALATSATSGQPGAPVAALASATLEGCTTAVESAARSATFNGQMSAVPGSRRMAMQIAVQGEAPGESSFRTLAAAGLGGWRRSEVGVKIYKYVRQVTDLPAPGAYRAIVQFRWLSEKGRVIKRAVRRTAICVQPDERPRLLLAQVLAAPVPGTQLAAYRLVVRNDGHGPAGAFQVALSVNGVAQSPLSVASLGAGSRTVLDARGPLCAAGGRVEVVLDPGHLLSEAPGGGQSDTLPCPLAEPGSPTS